MNDLTRSRIKHDLKDAIMTIEFLIENVSAGLTDHDEAMKELAKVVRALKTRTLPLISEGDVAPNQG